MIICTSKKVTWALSLTVLNRKPNIIIGIIFCFVTRKGPKFLNSSMELNIFIKNGRIKKILFEEIVCTTVSELEFTGRTTRRTWVYLRKTHQHNHPHGWTCIYVHQITLKLHLLNFHHILYTNYLIYELVYMLFIYSSHLWTIENLQKWTWN